MKTCAKCLLVLILCMGSIAWAANDYTLEYSMIDISGGAVRGAVAPSEDILSAELSGASLQSSAAYSVSSVLRWPSISRPQSAAMNWALYR